MIRAASLTLVIVLALPFTGQCRIWYVKPDGTGDVPTIAEAVRRSPYGDTVLLADGVFTGSGNKALVRVTRLFTSSPNQAILRLAWSTVAVLTFLSFTAHLMVGPLGDE